jgi:hypothetical protein
VELKGTVDQVLLRFCLSIIISNMVLILVLTLPPSLSQPEFYRVCHTKAQYDEEGPRIARHSPVFSASM